MRWLLALISSWRQTNAKIDIIELQEQEYEDSIMTNLANDMAEDEADGGLIDLTN